MDRRRIRKTTLPTRIQVCESCGEVFETLDDTAKCPGGCNNRPFCQRDDPCGFDDTDAFRKSDLGDK